MTWLFLDCHREREIANGTDNSKFKEVDGELVPFSFSQQFEMAQGAFFR
jgi:hypothetical protein